MWKEMRNAAYIVGITVLYVAAGKFGLDLAFVHPSVTAVWAPTGIALVAFLLCGNRVWPGIMIGAFVVNLTTSGSIPISLGIAIGNTLEAATGAYLLKKYANGINVFERVQDILKFILTAALLSTMVSATIGVTSLVLGHAADWKNYGSLWMTWWLGDAVGDLIIAPLLLLWGMGWRKRWDVRNVLEFALLMGLLYIAGQVVFGGLLPLRVKNDPLTFVCTPIIIWAAFWFDQREIAASNLMISAIAIWGTLKGNGPFVRPSQNESILLLQAFMGITSIMSIAVAGLVSERRKLIAELQHMLAQVKTLRGLLPICAWCKKIRDDGGYWLEVETYLHEHSEVEFSHGVCPDCLIKYKSEYIRKRQIT
ncbi:MAG TPA: MASE1 domain-containing protein [Bacteroidota bacterium]|jgi:integral membrane sensor domain MASE1|nr:MASE1 domain-containing protein [Bacteroidota bacterium]